MLGYPQEALQLAITGRHSLARAYNRACTARLFALQARAHAALGETRQAAHAVVESEHAFEHSDSDAKPEWARFIDDAYLSGEYAKTFGDLCRPVESTRFARHSIATARTQRRARREAFSQAALAHAALAHQDLETAVRAAHRAVACVTDFPPQLHTHDGKTIILAEALIAEGICAEVTPDLAEGYAGMLTPTPE